MERIEGAMLSSKGHKYITYSTYICTYRKNLSMILIISYIQPFRFLSLSRMNTKVLFKRYFAYI